MNQALTALLAVLVGLVLLVTGLVQKCPLNRLLGLDTYRREEAGVPEEE